MGDGIMRMGRPRGKPACSVCKRPFTPVRRAHVVDHPNLLGGVDHICEECWKHSMEGESK